MSDWTFEGKHVLVVEDDYFIADDFRETLEQAGARVCGPAATVKEALFCVEKEDIDCALLDVHLQEELVYAVAHQLGERGIPFVFLTGYDAEAIHPDYGRVPRIEKPFNLLRARYAFSKLQERDTAA